MRRSTLYVKIKPINVILTKLCCSESCPQKHAFTKLMNGRHITSLLRRPKAQIIIIIIIITKLMKFNFISKSVDATVYVRKTEARASRDNAQKRPTNYCRSCPGQSRISFRKRTEFLLSKTSLPVVKLSTTFRRTDVEM